MHHPHSGSPSYFAPDPDPEVPSVKLPPTTDPHSLPSNGQVPLDLYLQQEAEKNSISEHQTADSGNSNTLTAQDLFNLLNYQPGNQANPVGLIPQTQLHQHVLQPNVQFYNPALLVSQAQPQVDTSHNAIAHHTQQFAPQFQTFNYDEQTQQGAYGSDSFPAASMNLNLPSSKDFIQPKSNDDKVMLVDNEVAGSDNEETYEKVSENEIVQQNNEARKLHTGTKDISANIKTNVNKSVPPESLTKYTSHIPGHVIADNLNIQTTAKHEGTNNNKEGADMADHQVNPTPPKPPTNIDENVELHKSIQIYETSYHSDEGANTEEIKDLNEYSDDYTGEQTILKELGIQQPSQNNEGKQQKENIHFVDAVPYGTRIRPKRF